MEMPIAIVITLFVGIAVALLVINFSSGIINQGNVQLKQFSLACEKDMDFFVDISSISPSEVANLADLCYQNNLGKYEGDRLCYILHGPIEGNPIQDINPENLDPALTDLSNPGKTLYLFFSEKTQKVFVTG